MFDEMIMEYEMEEIEALAATQAAHAAHKAYVSKKRKQDITHKKHKENTYKFARYCGKFFMPNGSEHSRVRTNYGLRPTPSRWTRADMLDAINEYELDLELDDLEKCLEMESMYDECDYYDYYHDYYEDVCEDIKNNGCNVVNHINEKDLNNVDAVIIAYKHVWGTAKDVAIYVGTFHIMNNLDEIIADVTNTLGEFKSLEVINANCRNFTCNSNI